YADADGDGVGGGVAVELAVCVPVDPSLLMSSDDCVPDDPTVYPGAPDLCDGIDQDCDGADNCHPSLSVSVAGPSMEVSMDGERSNQFSGVALAEGDFDGDGDPDLFEASALTAFAPGTQGGAHLWTGPWTPGTYPLSSSTLVYSGERGDSEMLAAVTVPDITGD